MAKKVREFIGSTVKWADLSWKVFTFLTVLGGSTTAAILASASDMFGSAGYVAWLAVALVAGVLISLIFFLARAAEKARAEAAMLIAFSARASSVNPLAASFEDLVIPLSALYLPRGKKHERKQFRRCQFVGPGYITAIGCHFQTPRFNGCNPFIAVQADAVQVCGSIAFEGCIFESCQFFDLAVLVGGKDGEQLGGIDGLTVLKAEVFTK